MWRGSVTSRMKRLFIVILNLFPLFLYIGAVSILYYAKSCEFLNVPVIPYVPDKPWFLIEKPDTKCYKDSQDSFFKNVKNADRKRHVHAASIIFSFCTRDEVPNFCNKLLKIFKEYEVRRTANELHKQCHELKQLKFPHTYPAKKFCASFGISLNSRPKRDWKKVQSLLK